MSDIQYAIKITTDDGAGNLDSQTDLSVGLNGGIFSMITGRPGYTGLVLAPVPAGGTSITKWVEGLIDRSDLGNVTLEIQLDKPNFYGTMSSFDFTLRNSAGSGGFANRLRTLGIELIGRKIEFYVVIDGYFFIVWTGIIDTDNWTLIDYRITAIDSFLKIHQIVPGSKIPGKSAASTFTDNEFTDIALQARLPLELKNVPIPLAIGQVGRAKLFPVDDTTDPIIITTSQYDLYSPSGDDPLEVTGATAYSSTPDSNSVLQTSITLKTEDMTFAANDIRLVNRFLVPVLGTGSGGTAIRIQSNTATTGSGDSKVTVLKLAAALGTAPVLWSIGSHSLVTTYFQVRTSTVPWIVSALPVTSFTSFPTRLGTYDVQERIEVDSNRLRSGLKFYENIGAMVDQVSVTDISGSRWSSPAHASRPGVTLADKFLDLDGTIKAYRTFKPAQIKYYADPGNRTAATGFSEPADGTDVTADLTDGSTSTYVDMAWDYNHTANPSTGAFVLKIRLPDIGDKDYTAIYVAIDTDFIYSRTGGSNNDDMELFIGCYGTDMSARYTDYCVGDGNDVFDPAKYIVAVNNLTNPQTVSSRLIPKQYYGLDPDDGHFQYRKAVIDITKLVTSNASKKVYGEIYLNLATGILPDGHWSQHMISRIFEVAIVVEDQYNTSGSDVYGRVDGEPRASTWPDADANDRRVSGASCLGPADNIEHLLRTHDGLTAAQIDTDSFDNVDDTKRPIMIGKQLRNDQALNPSSSLPQGKSNVDWIKEICAQTMIAMVPLTDGRRRLVDWMNDSSAVVHTHDGSAINKDSIASVARTGMDTVFSQPQLRYGWDPLNTGFTAIIGLDKIKEESAFPAEATAGDGNEGALKWKSFAPGFTDYDYAKKAWEVCRSNYRKTLVLKDLPDECKNADWVVDLVDFLAPDFDIEYADDTENSAYWILRDHITWWTLPKYVVRYTLPMDASNLAIELLDQVDFSDSAFSIPNTGTAWVTKKTINAKDDTVELEVMIYPTTLPDLDP